MEKMLERIHQKPETYRRNLAMAITVSLSAIIFIVWAVSLPGRLTVGGDGNKNAGTVSNAASTGGPAAVGSAGAEADSPFEALSSGFGNAVNGAKQQFNLLLKVIE